MHPACAQREHGPQTLVGLDAHAQAVLQRPVVLVDGEDRHVRRASRGQRAQLVRRAEHARRIDRHHADDVGEANAKRDQLVHHLDEREGTRAPDRRQLPFLASERARPPDTTLVPTPDRVAVDVRTDSERHDPRVEGDARGVEAHVAAAADVDAYAARHGFEDQRMHIALARYEGAGMLRERVRENVARIEERYRVVDDTIGIDHRPVFFRPEAAEVHVDRHLGGARRFLPQTQRLDAPARVAADIRVTLDALDEVAVLLDGVDRFADVDPVRAIEADMTMSEETAHEVVRDEGIDAGGGRVPDELSEALDGERGGAALVDDRGDARANANLVRVHPEITGDVLVDVGVRVDQTGGHQLIPRVDRAGGRARHLARHLRDRSVFHRDVMDTIDPRGGIDHAATADDQVERRHGILR